MQRTDNRFKTGLHMTLALHEEIPALSMFFWMIRLRLMCTWYFELTSFLDNTSKINVDLIFWIINVFLDKTSKFNVNLVSSINDLGVSIDYYGKIYRIWFIGKATCPLRWEVMDFKLKWRKTFVVIIGVWKEYWVAWFQILSLKKEYLLWQEESKVNSWKRKKERKLN